MGAAKHYLNNLICACALDQGFAQNAIEHAIISGAIKPTGDLNRDVETVMSQYDHIIETHQRLARQNTQALAANHALLLSALGLNPKP